jgi:hypothetical protein
MSTRLVLKCEAVFLIAETVEAPKCINKREPFLFSNASFTTNRNTEVFDETGKVVVIS